MFSQQLGEWSTGLISVPRHTHTPPHTHPFFVFENILLSLHILQGHVLFRPTVSQQQSCPTCSTSLLNGDFTVTYDVNRNKLCDLLVRLKLLV